MKLRKIILHFFERLVKAPQIIYVKLLKHELGLCAKDSNIESPVLVCNYPRNIFLHEGSNIRGNSMFLNTPSARFIIGKKSKVGQGLTVITNNHQSPPTLGVFYADSTMFFDNHNKEKDVIVEEDVWIGANVTLLAGVVVGRGAIVGSGAVCTKYIPPYAVVVGVPARVVKFKFLPEEVIEHERRIYPVSERLPLLMLKQNYDKYMRGDK